MMHSPRKKAQSITLQNILQDFTKSILIHLSSTAPQMHAYKAKAAKAKTTDKAMAMEFTIDTEVEPGALPV
jgi:hypothetical protein